MLEDTTSQNTPQEDVKKETTIQAQEQNESSPEHEDPNWKAFREARKRDRMEKEAAERKAAEKAAEAEALKAAMEAAFAKQNPREQTYGGYEDESEDVRIEKKIAAILEAREQARQREMMERDAREYPNRLAQEHPDFSSVVNQDTLDYLEYHYPEIARPLKRLPDGYDKWNDVYHTIKKLIPNSQNSQRDISKAQVNSQKPKSMNAPGVAQDSTPTPTYLSEERKKNNWERMQRAMKGLQ